MHVILCIFKIHIVRFVALLSSVIKNLTVSPAETLCHFETNVNVNN